MNEGLPAGWMPIPFGLEDADAAQAAAQLTEVAVQTMPGFVESEQARAALMAAIARAPVMPAVFARVWHALGPSATGAIADLSVVDGAEDAPDSPFAYTIRQRTYPFDGGRAVLSLVAPAEHLHVGLLLRAQRRLDDRVLVADVVGVDASTVGLIVGDVIALVGGSLPAEEVEPHRLIG